MQTIQCYTPPSDDFAALHEGRTESKPRRALSNDARKFISEEYSQLQMKWG